MGDREMLVRGVQGAGVGIKGDGQGLSPGFPESSIT